MKKLKQWLTDWRKQFKFAIYDPSNFSELFGFTTSKVRIVSFVTLIVIFFIAFTSIIIIKTPIGRVLIGSEKIPSKKEIIKQQKKIDSLARRVDAQELYINGFKKLLIGEFDEDTTVVSSTVIDLKLNQIDTNPSEAETKIEETVKANQRTSTNQSNEYTHFLTPVKGKISQHFNKKYKSINITALEGTYFYTCLSGTVVYSDYSPLDGNVIIIEHPNNYLSVYKHAKTTLKKAGDKVRVGDIIGVVGKIGINSTESFLHFELWYNQQPINPEDYIDFE